MAAIVALAFVACAGLYKHSLVGRITMHGYAATREAAMAAFAKSWRRE